MSLKAKRLDALTTFDVDFPNHRMTRAGTQVAVYGKLDGVLEAAIKLRRCAQSGNLCYEAYIPDTEETIHSPYFNPTTMEESDELEIAKNLLDRVFDIVNSEG